MPRCGRTSRSLSWTHATEGQHAVRAVGAGEAAVLPEGSDLYSQPFGLIYTRSITDPLWGARATYRSESADAAVLTVKDRGGGFVIPPGTYYSDAREQGASQATLARVRVPHGAGGGTGSVGALFSDRTYDDGSSNRTAAVDGQYKPNDDSRLRARFSASQTDDRVLGSKGDTPPAFVDALYDNGVYHGWLGLEQVSPEVPQRQLDHHAERLTNGPSSRRGVAASMRPFQHVCAGAFGGETRASSGAALSRWITPQLYMNGARNSEWSLQPRWINYSRVTEGGQWHHVPTLYAR